ncbi:AMP-binding protein [candidate division KSB1 bacterium]|nr:AMP-binding protein [candidate division KSB1 bacterium]
MKFGLSKYTLDLFLQRIVEKYPDRPILALVGEKPFTYAGYNRKIVALRENLQGLGIRKQDKIVILGKSSPNWAIAYMAIMTMGAVAVPVLEGFPESDIEHIIKHSEAVAIFITENFHQNYNLPSLTHLKLIIKLDDLSVISGTAHPKNKITRLLHDIPEKVMRPFDRSPDKNLDEVIDEDDIAEILYTSGTTGHSKGVMLTHKNLVSNLFEGPDLLKVINSNSVVLSILPMAHGFGSTSGFLSIIYCGGCIYYLNKAPSPKVLMDAMAEVRPTIFGAVPLVFEKIYHKKVVPTISSSFLLRTLMKTAFTKRLLYKLIGKKLYKQLGGRLDCIIIGGASFSSEVELFMQQGGIPYCCGYGLSECSPLVTFSSMESQKMGSPGHAITDVQIKIIDQDPGSGIGEICVKGPNVMKGYYRDEEATLRVFTSDGWFKTGDLGYLDEDGYLFITGRSKNVIIGPSGENIYPEAIEAKLLESIFVEETLVYELEDQIVARIYPNYSYIENLKSERDENTIASDINDLLEQIRKEVNAKLPAYSKISKIIEQSSPFVTTPTNKIKRAEYVPGYLEV